MGKIGESSYNDWCKVIKREAFPLSVERMRKKR